MMDRTKQPNTIDEEMKKCIKSPLYFYNKYWKIYDKNGNEIPKMELTQQDFNKRIKMSTHNF